MISLTTGYVTQRDKEITHVWKSVYFLVYHQYTKLLLEGQAVFSKPMKIWAQLSGSAPKILEFFIKGLLFVFQLPKQCIQMNDSTSHSWSTGVVCMEGTDAGPAQIAFPAGIGKAQIKRNNYHLIQEWKAAFSS